MPTINGRLVLEQDAAFEEISEQWYTHLLNCVPPERWAHPGRNLGWFICGEPHSYNPDKKQSYAYLCFRYNGRYYAGNRSVGKPSADYEWEISAFCRELDTAQN